MITAPVVEVKWRDACSRGGWRDVSHTHHDRPLCVTSVGYLLHKDKRRVTLALSLAANDDVGDTLTVPRSWILRVRTLRSEATMRKEQQKRGRA